MRVIDLSFPLPPSLNHSHKNIRFRGKGGGMVYGRAPTRESISWKTAAALNARAAMRRTLWPKSVGEKLVMEVWYYWPDRRRRDCDNHKKLLLDALKGVLFDDDHCVLSRDMDYNVDRTYPRMVVRIFPLVEVALPFPSVGLP